MVTFSRYVRRIRRQLAETPGLIGYSMRANLFRHRFWTLSVWEDEMALMAFVEKDPHRTTMGALQPHMDATGFIRWKIAGPDVPPSWDDAMRRSASKSARQVA
jgi:heme-degrading monooxygenase HmoA